jgi:hypothetical protein
MNTPAPTTDPDLCPSQTVDEAVERLVAAHHRCILELERQRDELAACLREARAGFVNGRFTCNDVLRAEGISNFALFVQRCDQALLRCDVRERLDDRVAAEQRKQEGAV